MRAIVVAPTYNERDNLELFVSTVHRVCPELHILIVDDNSPDGTGKLADELSARDPEKVFVLHRSKKEGLGPAYIDGFKLALKQDYEYVLQMDADLSHDPHQLQPFFEKIKDHDLVVGSRYLNGISVVNWDLKRLMLSKFATRYVQLVTGMPLTDATSGFICWRRETLEKINFEDAFSTGYIFLVEMKYKVIRKGLKVAEVPIIFVERKTGDSKLDWKVIWEAFWGVFRIRFKR
jgi:dolichol-phosphate mannosyltransferase